MHSALSDGLKSLGFEVLEDYTSAPEAVAAKLQDCSGLIIRSRFPVDAFFLRKVSHLRFIGRVGAGLENIDTAVAKELGIEVLSAPEGNRNAVGEHALGMLLMLLNNLRRADAEVRQGIWKREENRGYELDGRTVGIIGYGNMGSAFAAKLAGFDVKILAYDKYKKGYGSNRVEECSLEKLQQEADVISFHVPQTEETLHYLDETFIEACARPFYLINTARGKVVKTEALVEGLKSGNVPGACLDVLEYEKASFENLFSGELPAAFRYLVNSDKVVLSPHIAGWTHESNRKMAEVIVRKVKDIVGSKE